MKIAGHLRRADSFSQIISSFTLATVLVVPLAVLAGCTTTQAEPAPLVTASAEVPILTPLAETREAQDKGGIQISIAPAAYSSKLESVEISAREVSPSVIELLGVPSKNPHARFIERTHKPVLEVLPKELRFTVKINNKLPRVFRASGTVVQFNVAGKLASVDQAGYAELANAIVPPRGEQQVNIYGPPIADIPPNSTVGLFLYDVPTRTDSAGNIVEKQNFEWYFKVVSQHREQSGAVTVQRRWEE